MTTQPLHSQPNKDEYVSRPALFLGMAALVFSVGALSWLIFSPKTTPAPIATAITRMPYDPERIQKTVTSFAERSRRDPKDWLSVSLLSGYYLERCRETGDIADAVRAEQTARRSLQIFHHHNTAASNQLALALFTQHRFPEALAALNYTGKNRTALHAADPQTRYLIAEIAMEMGDYAEAEEALHLPETELDTPNGNALRARLLEFNGQPERALALMRRAQTLADKNSDMPLPSVAWFHNRAGDLLVQMGRDKEAEQSYREALALFPRDYRSLTALARLSAGRGDWPAVLDWGGKSAAIVPTPEVVALLGDAYSALGRAKEAEEQYALVETIARLMKAQGAVYDRQRALFCADHRRNLDEGLALARRELQQRHDVYAYDTLAWACFQKGLLSEADTAMQKAMVRGTQEARFFYHAGRIAEAQGRHEEARNELQKALAINPYFAPFAPQKARKLLVQIDAEMKTDEVMR